MWVKGRDLNVIAGGTTGR